MSTAIATELARRVQKCHHDCYNAKRAVWRKEAELEIAKHALVKTEARRDAVLNEQQAAAQ